MKKLLAFIGMLLLGNPVFAWVFTSLELESTGWIFLDKDKQYYADGILVADLDKTIINIGSLSLSEYTWVDDEPINETYPGFQEGQTISAEGYTYKTEDISIEPVLTETEFIFEENTETPSLTESIFIWGIVIDTFSLEKLLATDEPLNETTHLEIYPEIEY